MNLAVSLRHRFGGFTLDVAFEAPGGVTVLFGRSGAGKTTVVNALSGLLAPDGGLITLDGVTLLDTGRRVMLPPHRRRIGTVFQDARLFPHLTVRRNLAYGHWFAGQPEKPGLAEVVALLGLEALLERMPDTLSGGEKSRVAIGRALLSGPQMLLMDEPLASLDEPRKAEILPYLERLRDEIRVPILYVSHALAEVARLATTLVVLDQGRVVRMGPAAEMLADPEAVPLLGVREAGAVIVARVVAHHADGLSELATSAGALHVPRVASPPGALLRLRIQARDVMLALERPVGVSALNILPCVVRQIHGGSGPGVAVGLMSGQDALLARITRRSCDALGLAPGLACFAILKSVSLAGADIGQGPPERPGVATD